MRDDSPMKAGRLSRGRWAVALSAALVSLGVLVSTASAAPAAGAEIVAADDEFLFIGGPFEQARGEVAVFVNPETSGALHNVYATGRGPDGRPLFFSETIYPGSESPVRGTQYLGTGSYPFVCTLHTGMDGTLEVTGAGVPVTRPSMSVKFSRQRLAAVARSGKLRIEVRSPTGVRGGGVTVKVGKLKVAVLRSIALSAGAKRKLVAKLTPRGRKVLKGRKAVTFVAAASVEFGRPSSTRKVLR